MITGGTLLVGVRLRRRSAERIPAPQPCMDDAGNPCREDRNAAESSKLRFCYAQPAVVGTRRRAGRTGSFATRRRVLYYPQPPVDRIARFFSSKEVPP